MVAAVKPRSAAIVVDLGFGDAGKGALVDRLTRDGADWIVRFNGGAQAGHNVVTRDGRHHTFAQFGAGTLASASARTLLSRFVVVHPTALLVEARHLERVGVREPLLRVAIDERALVTTPYHQAAGRLREELRGSARHGSCGVGVGETVADSLSAPELTIVAGDLVDRARLARKSSALRERKRAEMIALGAGSLAEFSVFDDEALAERWIDAIAPAADRVVSRETAEAIVAGARRPVFEGAQGVLLDEDHGGHPHTTWSRCTFENASALLAESRFEGPIERLGVVRAYAVRHGAGPLPTEDAILEHDEPHNATGPWQGAFRFGHFDRVLFDYALAACGGVDGVALTHVDQLGPRHGIALAYEGMEALRPGGRGDLEASAARGRLLARARPIVEPLAGDPVKSLRAHVAAPVRFIASGPTADDYRAT